MAIKTISQLDQFNNGSPSQSIGCVGGNMRLYSNNTEMSPGDLGIRKSHGFELKELSTSFRWSLFEVSQPQITDKAQNEFFYSKQIPYADLVKNIIADTKQYLNAHNGLFDNDLATTISDNCEFTGHKVFTPGGAQQQGGVEIKGGFIVDDAVITRSLSVTSSDPVIFDSYVNISNDLNVDGNINANFLAGGAYCLKDNPSTTTTVPTGYNQGTRIGNPVCFVDGRPHELSSVSIAENAKNLVDPSGLKYNIGYGERRTTPYGLNYSAVYLSNGVPMETNVIDYAEHAYWSDLGEKYLGDKIYEPGTLIKFGGKNEITIADNDVNAIVSTKAFDLNAGLEGGTVIALCGRVPTKVIGKIKKFDSIVLSNVPGVARARRWYDFFNKTIGKSLESNNEKNVKMVECVTRFIFD